MQFKGTSPGQFALGNHAIEGMPMVSHGLSGLSGHYLFDHIICTGGLA